MRFKNILMVCLIVGLIFPLFLYADTGKMHLRRSIVEENVEHRVHPFQDWFDEQRVRHVPNARSANFNRLLILLVDFQESDNPLTTGNGKFILEPDHNFPISLGSPPYDREFFLAQAEALRYYYLAVSFGLLDLDIDIYPRGDKGITAYTLPEEMAFYHSQNPNQFVERLELYFEHIFDVAERSVDRPERFSDYGHFMVIHAGSNWQNDVFRDTPHDLPSFFISFAYDGADIDRRPLVDGYFRVPGVANVPEHLNQDFRKRHALNEEGKLIHTIVRGYGAINSVMAHEFGHSLGFVDLYNTLNGRPGAGVFDIMCSGGQGILTIDVVRADSLFYYFIEGALPVLPSVWSRLIPFEEIFLQNGILVDIDAEDLMLDSELRIKASSAKNDGMFFETPYFYRVRLSADEYILIENRNVDPDGDGGTAFQGALWREHEDEFKSGRRVLLHPSPRHTDGFTYEYDWLLPSWVDRYDYSYGGGLLIWHIDDRIIGDRNDPNSNFWRNRVNAFRTRGVNLIEADGLVNIGNPASWLWTGTEYEYFFRYMPIIDEYGDFTGWYDGQDGRELRYHNHELSANTKPALRTNTGRPSNWRIANISQADRIMTFTITNSMFDYTSRIYSNIFIQSEIFNISGVANLPRQEPYQFSFLTDRGMIFYTQSDNPAEWDFYSQISDINTKPDFDVITTSIRGDGQHEYLLVYGNRVVIVDGQRRYEFVFEDEIVIAPLYFNSLGDHYLCLNFADKSTMYRLDFENEQTEEVVSSVGIKRFILDDNYLYSLNTNYGRTIIEPMFSLTHNEFVHTEGIPPVMRAEFTKFDPIVYIQQENQGGWENRNTIFLMSDNYNVYSATGSSAERIFELSKFTTESPSQMALGYTPSTMSNFVVFHTESMVFVISEDGSLHPNFPVRLDRIRLKPYSYPYVFSFDDEIIFMLNDADQGLLGLDLKGQIRPEFSQYWDKGSVKPQFMIDEENDHLMMIYTDADNNLFAGAKKIDPDDKIIWNGFRNGGNGILRRTGDFVPVPVVENVAVYAFPNPVRQGVVNVRIWNAKDDGVINIYNLAGQLVHNEKVQKPVEHFGNFTIDTSRFSSGVYFLQVEIGGKTYRDRFAVIR